MLAWNSFDSASMFKCVFSVEIVIKILNFQNENIISAIYNIDWYLLKEPERKSILLMLQKSQNYTEMSIGGFASLNVETLVAV